MTKTPPPDASSDTAFRRAATMLAVADVQRSAEHYRDMLGFTIGGIWLDVPYAVLRRGGVEIHLRQAPTPTPPSSSGIYVFVSSADAVYEELTGRGVTPLGESVDQFYGLRDFGVRDLDGHLLMFSSPIAT